MNGNVDEGVPVRPKLQLVLRVTGEESVEVVRDIKPLWTREAAKGLLPFELVIAANGFPADPKEEMLRIVAEELHKEATPDVLADMLRVLMSKAAP